MARCAHLTVVSVRGGYRGGGRVGGLSEVGGRAEDRLGRGSEEEDFFVFFVLIISIAVPGSGYDSLSSSLHMSACGSFYFSFFICSLFVAPNLWFFGSLTLRGLMLTLYRRRRIGGLSAFAR
jgi:hypothetical protein